MTAATRPAPTAIDRLRVDLGKRGYEIVIGDGLLADAGSHIAPLLKQPRVMVITDQNVAGRHLPTFATSLGRAGIRCQEIVLAPGERTKDFSHLESLTDRVLASGIERATTLVALGGGVIGDLVGFAAAVILRGLPFVQVPTTLLAQVDSSVGGKTAINTRHGKNLVGAFHQPVLVLADVGVLDTLPRRELLAGYAEVLKYGLIGDPAFFAWLEAHGGDVIAGDRAARRHAVRTSCAAKASVVAADETERGERALLNLGHTFGHALEAETGYGDALLHGESVAIGMALAFRLSVRLGLCPAEDERRLVRHLADIGLPWSIGRNLRDPSWSAERLLAHMSKDKKVSGGKLTFILARGIGRAFITRDVPENEVRAVLTDALRD